MQHFFKVLPNRGSSCPGALSVLKTNEEVGVSALCEGSSTHSVILTCFLGPISGQIGLYPKSPQFSP